MIFVIAAAGITGIDCITPGRNGWKRMDRERDRESPCLASGPFV
ncbi:hypothetical protein [Methanoregula sp.]|nr:hypothetical protein [Methanoregula sp.]